MAGKRAFYKAYSRKVSGQRSDRRGENSILRQAGRSHFTFPNATRKFGTAKLPCAEYAIRLSGPLPRVKPFKNVTFGPSRQAI
jgi:hypothetical protein